LITLKTTANLRIYSVSVQEKINSVAKSMHKRIVSFTLAIIFTLVISSTVFVRPVSASPEVEFYPLSSQELPLSSQELIAFANGDLTYEFLAEVIKGLGGGLGGVLGSAAACYAVDVMILPFNPPLAAYFATVCHGIGGVVGGSGGFIGATKMVGE
jgi:hypothetical protein